MHFTKYITVVALIATGVLAAPGTSPRTTPARSTRAKPTATVVSQTNTCGNGAAPWCCNTESDGKYSSCKVMGAGSICSATTVCCNANNSIQVCLGNAVIEV